MPKVIYRLPSKAIQYGYAEIEIELTDEQAANPEQVGAAYATYVGAFLEGEKGGLDLFLRGRDDRPSESHTEPRTVNQVMSDEDVDTEAEAVAILKKEMSATVVSEETPPWQKKAEAKQPKPWERETEKPATQAGAPEVADIDW